MPVLSFFFFFAFLAGAYVEVINMSDFVIFLVEKLGKMPEEMQDYFYENPEKLEEGYGKERLEELRNEYLKMQEV